MVQRSWALVVVVILVVCAAASAYYATSPGSKKRVLKLNKKVHDFGSIQQQEEVETTFNLTNIGQKPLKVIRLASSCSCSQSTLDCSMIEPGKTATLDAKLHSGTQRGDKRYTIYVLFRIGDEELLRKVALDLTANVQSDYTVRPSERLVFSSRQNGARQLTIIGEKPAFRIDDAYTDQEAFKVTIGQKPRQSEGAAREYNLSVRFDPIAWDKDAPEATLTVVTTSKLQEKYLIPIAVRR